MTAGFPILSGKMSPALRLTACLLALPPLAASPHLDFARGVLEEQRENAAAAVAAFEKALSADPGALPLVQRVATHRLEAKDLEGASTLFRELATAHPERVEVQVAYADFLRNYAPNDDFAAKLACEALETAAEKAPENISIHQRLFRLYEQRGMRERSLAIFESLADDPSPNASRALAAASMARTLFPQDDEATRARIDVLFRTAVETSPANRALARAASEHFRNTGRLPEAIEMLSLHTDAAPSSLELRVRLGILLLAAKRDPEGEKTLLDVLGVDARQGLAHQTLAKFYRRREQPEKARPHAAEALKLRGGDPSEFLELAAEFLDADLPRDARLLLEKAVFYHPEDASLAAKLSIAARRDPESQETASRLFREAEQMSGDDGPAAAPDFLVESAESLLESGQQPAAEDRLRRAIRAFPADRKKETAAALRRLAGLWEKDNRNAEAARALLQRAQALDPAP